MVSSQKTFGEFARTLLSWRHSGFSIDGSTRIYDTEARQGLCRYILRAPLAIRKLEWDPPYPPQSTHLLRRYGLCASRARGTWKKRPALSSRDPEDRYGRDVWACPACGGRMSVIAFIRDPAAIRKIVTCMAKQGRGPPQEG
jgi:hypothetical protein